MVTNPRAPINKEEHRLKLGVTLVSHFKACCVRPCFSLILPINWYEAAACLLGSPYTTVLASATDF